MRTDSEIDEINRSIWELWRDHPRDAGPVAPKFVVSPKQEDSLLFLGLNPAFPEEKHLGEHEAWKIIKRQMVDVGLLQKFGDKYQQAFSWVALEKLVNNRRAAESQVISLLAAIHHEARQFYEWFKHLDTVAEKLGVKSADYGQVDLYLWADSNSKTIGQRVQFFTSEDYLLRQQALTMRLVKAHKPRMIICVYKSAWESFKEMCEGHEARLSDSLVYLLNPTPCEQVAGNADRKKLWKAKLECVNAKFEWADTEVPIIGCPNLPRGRRTGDMMPEHFPEFFTFIKTCWEDRTVNSPRIPPQIATDPRGSVADGCPPA